jgi:hypothetical protein
MPRRDRTGPEGEGPMTGWGAGDCAAGDYAVGRYAGQPAWGYAGPMRGGRARGRRPRGQGGRQRNRFYAPRQPGRARFGPVPGWAPPTPEQETEALKAQAEWLRGELDAIDQRLGELENIE